jgi:hypothetical protein
MTKVRCCALDMNGKRCRRIAVALEQYHGDSELYGSFKGRPPWVEVAFCIEHRAPPRVVYRPRRRPASPSSDTEAGR